MLRVQRFRDCSRVFSAAAAQDFNKTEENGIAHTTAINTNSGDRSIVQIAKNDSRRFRRFRREFSLPNEAITGLRQALIESKRTPKQIQYEADQLNERLDQRKFPAAPVAVKKLRDQVKKSILKNKEYEPDDILGDQKMKKAQEHDLRHRVDKLMKKTRYNWKPLQFNSPEDASTYALARLSRNYAEIARCLEELPDFDPNSVLDFGSGCGAGYWAVKERFSNVKEISLIDTSDHMTKMAMDIMRDESGQVIDKRVQFRRHLLPSLQTTYDLVVGHRFLSEIGSEEARIAQVEELWKRTNRYLVIIESAQDESFDALLNVRDYLLIAGTTVSKEFLLRLLKKNEEVDKVRELLEDNTITDIEKYTILREMLPEFDIPTKLPTATVVAPCPHDLGCPLRGKSTCSFNVRWKPIRADGKSGSRRGDGTETGTFSFVILEKGNRESGEKIDRILKLRKLHGHTTCDICTAFRGIQRITVSKRAGSLYQALKTRRDGELFPLTMQTKATEGIFDLYEYGKSSVSN